MSQTTKHLGFLIKNRGEYISNPETKYYKDNVVQYMNSSFICDPEDYDEQDNPLAFVTIPPLNSLGNINSGWKVFAIGSDVLAQQAIEEAKEEALREINNAVQEYAPIQVTGDVVNAADEEDITSVNVGGTDVLKLKDKSYNSLVFSGLGRTNLRKNIQEVTVEGVTTTKNILTQAMMNDANTIYKIQYDYDLNGSTITVPAGCTLEFDGGSITGDANAVLNLNGCQLTGSPRFNNVVFSGDIKNGTFDATWIMNGSDIGEKLNYAQQYFKRLCIPDNTYEFSTYIKLENIQNLNINGRLRFTGTPINNDSAFEILKSANCDIHIHILTNDNIADMDYTDTRSVNFIGICFTSCNNINVQIDAVNYFNENVRFQDLYGTGCSYNKIKCLYNSTANIGIRFYADNSYGTSWCNETAILGGRFTKLGISKPFGTTYGIVVASLAFDNENYRKQGVTSMDSSSNIHVYNSSFEGLDIGAYFRNVQGCGVHYCREEAMTYIMKLVGNTRNCYYDYTYARRAIDFSEVTGNAKIITHNNKSVDVYINNGSPYPRYSYKNIFCNSSSINVDKLTSAYLSQIGIILNTSTNKYYTVSVYDKYNNIITALGPLIVKYLNSEGTAVVENMQNYPKPNAESNWDNYQYGFGYAYAINVPSGIDRIFVGVTLSLSTAVNYDKIVIESYDTIEVIATDKKTIGTTENRPTSLPLGMEYYDTTLGKPIYYSEPRWVDKNGYTATIDKGTTEQRPTDTLTTSDAGYQYFDTTLGMPIYLKVTGSTKSWVKADGTDA